jgi:hypothetical protein
MRATGLPKAPWHLANNPVAKIAGVLEAGAYPDNKITTGLRHVIFQ